jgi:GNAT superfamily N-acetyltransferase
VTPAEASRLATVDDLSELERLATAAVAEQRDDRGGWVWSRREIRPQPYAASFRAALEDPAAAVWMGTFGDIPVGYAAAHVESLRDGSPLAVVDDLYVEPAARGVGVGEALMTDVVAWATARACIGIDGWVLPGNRASKNFFETFGFTARGIVVHRSLRPAEM